ncbi:MAG: septum site-determining protein MinC [Ferrimonas sp.]
MDANTVEFKGGSFIHSVLSLSGSDLTVLTQQLADHIQKAPSLFAQMPVILHVDGLDESITLETLLQQITTFGLAPMAIQAQQRYRQVQAKELAIPLFTKGRNQKQTLYPPLIIERPVRSGQQLYAEGTDLIVLGSVGAGAELVADGSIHVFGAMRGRIFAGASGLKEARIFCHNQQAELLSIAGHYQLTEHIAPENWGQAVMVSLDQQKLIYSPLTESFSHSRTNTTHV